MQCFNHPEVAVAICKCCGRGLCQTCARSSALSVVCSDACATQVQASMDLFSRSRSAFGTTASIYRALAIIFIVLALVVIWLPTMIPILQEGALAFRLIALVCMLAAVFTFIASRRLKYSK